MQCHRLAIRSASWPSLQATVLIESGSSWQKSGLMIQHQIKRRRLASTGVDFVRGPGKDDFGEVLGAQTHCGLPRPPRG